VKQIRKRLTYANVMSSIAVFLVLGGATAFAASKITAKQLQSNSVTTAKIKKNAVTASKIKNNSITTSKVANGAITGAKVNLGSLGTVPSATSATNAAHANNADTVNGMHLTKIGFIGTDNNPKTAILNVNGLTLFAECDSNGELEFTATTSVINSEIYESGNFDETFDGSFDDSFSPGDVEEVGAEIGDHSQNEVQGQLVYSTPAGAVVTAQFSLNDGDGAYGNTRACNVVGTALSS
jgi:hypothetical protein